MFRKPKTPRRVPLGDRTCHPVLSAQVDYVEKLADGTSEIRTKIMPPQKVAFRDLGDAECYGIMYQQMKGVELKPVASPSRVSPMEAIDIANKAIDNIHVPNDNNT